MANPTVTNNDPSQIQVFDASYDENGIVVFAGADTFVVGTIMARKASGTTSAGYWVICAPNTGTDGANIPAGVLTYEITKTGSGNKYAHILIKGEVDKSKLLFDDGTTVDASHLAYLSNVGIIARTPSDLYVADNQ
jgi:hypothetical protein